jgi:hypothetical protein
VLAMAALAACGGTPQAKDEVAVSYRASFRAEAGVQTEVVFPFPSDALAADIQSGLSVSDGGAFEVKDTNEGRGLSLVGRGDVSISFSSARLKGLGSGTGIEGGGLHRLVPDAGVSDYSFRVNKGGTPTAQVDFQYELKKDCGDQCGGTKRWTYAGSVGLGPQQVTVNYTETSK